MNLPFAHSVARVGCFLAGCCYGKPTESFFGVSFPSTAIGVPAGTQLHPTHLYEAAWLLLIFSLLILVSRQTSRSGICCAGYFILYGLLRFVVEIFRGDDTARGIIVLNNLNISTSQVIALITVLLGTTVFGLRIFRFDNNKMNR